jgi:hypothetical protein
VVVGVDAMLATGTAIAVEENFARTKALVCVHGEAVDEPFRWVGT